MPDSGISTFWIFFFSTCVILNYTGKQLVSRDLQDRHLFNFAAKLATGGATHKGPYRQVRKIRSQV